MTGDPEAGDLYELTIVGELGRVLRWALRPGQVLETHPCTTFVTVAGTDLPSLVARLETPGLTLESVYVLGRSGTTIEE